MMEHRCGGTIVVQLMMLLGLLLSLNSSAPDPLTFFWFFLRNLNHVRRHGHILVEETRIKNSSLLGLQFGPSN
jgi:hypothetical protein